MKRDFQNVRAGVGDTEGQSEAQHAVNVLPERRKKGKVDANIFK